MYTATEASELKLFTKWLYLFDVMSKPILGIIPFSNTYTQEQEREEENKKLCT